MFVSLHLHSCNVKIKSMSQKIIEYSLQSLCISSVDVVIVDVKSHLVHTANNSSTSGKRHSLVHMNSVCGIPQMYSRTAGHSLL